MLAPHSSLRSRSRARSTKPASSGWRKRQIDSGVHFLVPCGTTGETPTLSAAERRRVVELVLEAADGQVPVMAGAGGYDTQEVVHVAKEMQSIGVQGLLSVTPYYNKPTPEGLYQHFSKIAEATPLPIMLYNVPGRTGCNIDAATLREAGDDSARHRRQGSVRQHHADGRDLPRGAAGLPGAVRRRCADAAVDGDWRPRPDLGGVERDSRRDVAAWSKPPSAAISPARAQMHHRLVPLMLGNFIESNPGPVKFAMAAMGLCEEVYRLPMVSPRPASQEKIRAFLKELDI